MEQEISPSVASRGSVLQSLAWIDCSGFAGASLTPLTGGFYVSGQLLTEDYYVANKLMKGFIGSAHVDTNSRLCMSSTVAGHKRVSAPTPFPAITRTSTAPI
jgi:assimilatory nitrate reductase catalytic subunit